MPWSCLKKKHFRLYIYIIIKFVFAKDVLPYLFQKLAWIVSFVLYTCMIKEEFMKICHRQCLICVLAYKLNWWVFFNIMIFLGINCYAWIYLFMLFLIIILWNYYLFEAVKFIGECIHRIKRVCLPQNTVDYLIFDGALKSTVIFFEKFWLKKFLISSCNLLDKFLIWNFNFLVDFILH